MSLFKKKNHFSLVCIQFFLISSTISNLSALADSELSCTKSSGTWTWNSNVESFKCYDANGNSLVTNDEKDSGENPNKITSSGYSILADACESGNIELIKSLINRGANINYQHADGIFPLYQFVTMGYSKNTPDESLKLVKWMIEKSADFKKRGYNKYTLIHASGDLELTKYLVELGMDINSLTENGATTLMGSMAFELEGKAENTAIQEYLIDHCVDLNQKAKFDAEVISASDFAKQYDRYKAYNLIENAIKNPPKQCRNQGILAPKISFYNLPETFDSENATINLEVEAQGSGMGDVVLLINGTEISSIQGNTSKTSNSGLRIKTYNIKLQNGLNEIRAFAYDEKNKIKSEEIIHNVVADYKITTPPKLYAVVIGIDQFQNPELNLKYAEADASLFGTTLFKRSKDLFSEINIEYMKKIDGTTKNAILKQLESLKNISANDFFVFYSATHGVSIDGVYYMITSNVQATDDQYIKQNAISEDELRQAFKQIPTANKLLLFDTCYSGSINEKISKQLAKNTVSKLNLTSITAANSSQAALEGFADGHGIFTFVLSDALDGEADINQDGIVQSMEIVNYANRMVPLEAKKFNHIQTPAYYQSGQVFSVSKHKNFKEAVNIKPQYYKPAEIEKLITYMDEKKVIELNNIIQSKAKQTVKTIEKIKVEAAAIEATKASETFKSADKTFQFGKHGFIFNDNSIFLDIKDPIKEHFHFVDSKGRNLIVFDFYSQEKAPRVVSELNTEKVSNIYMADRGEWYRVTLQTKSKQSYEHIVRPEGIFIKLKND